MKKLRCIIIDDEEMAVKVIENHLSQIEEMELVEVFYSGVEAFLSLDQIKPDVIFLDIQMPKLTGLSMLKMMKNQPLTVLTTAHRNFALEGFELDVVDYLLKPVGFERFLKTVKKINRLYQSNAVQTSTSIQAEQKDFIFIKANRRFTKVFFDDILLIEAVKNHVKITTTNHPYVSLINISKIETKLPTDQFLRVHRSYIVNLNRLTSFDHHSITISEHSVPIGRSYRDQVKEVLEGRISG